MSSSRLLLLSHLLVLAAARAELNLAFEAWKEANPEKATILDDALNKKRKSAEEIMAMVRTYV